MPSVRLVLSLGYASVGAISVFGYLPTILALLRKNRCANIGSFSIWTLTYAVTTAYAVVINHDPLFIAVSALGVSCCGLVVVLALRLRLRPSGAPRVRAR